MRASRWRSGFAATTGVALALAGALGCSVGQGTGDVHTKDLFAHDCWGTPLHRGHAGLSTQAVAQGACYDMQPDFFAANPYRDHAHRSACRTAPI